MQQQADFLLDPLLGLQIASGDQIGIRLRCQNRKQCSAPCPVQRMPHGDSLLQCRQPHFYHRRKTCLCLSNLGNVKLPEAMMPYVERMDFILSVQATQPYNCGVLSFGDELYINFVRNIREPKLESAFYQVLRDMGLPVQVQSNQPDC